MTRPANPRYGKSRPVDSTAAGRGVWMISLTRMVGSSAGREPVRDASRICAARLQALGASTQQPPRGSPHLAHARRKRARERCRPSFRQCTGWLGQDDCESQIERYRHSRLRKIKTPPRKVYLAEAQLWRGQAPSEVRACPLRRLQAFWMYQPPEQHAALTASAAVTAVTRAPPYFLDCRFGRHGLD